ncbi:MAG TPA: type II toxin-antitoxin system VapC family toxin [Solirubrobacteraceae bacterium]|nr:type II toxin-antitoxin system VapC family toxin [Solirubrobacteraceae bacterium]
MRTRLVCDASALVALLLDAGPDGRWAAQTLAGADLAAPSLVAFESSNIIRRHELAGDISSDQAAQAHADLLDLAIEPWPYELLARRTWELRRNLSVYDASYVALAELIDSTLVTLDARIAGAPGPRCRFATPR